ncbi:MAG: hypothetical protein KDA60_07535 [Planctomycetales bacterium]|nr:hypothetical protein [Planctomycetales bacterium]
MRWSRRTQLLVLLILVSVVGAPQISQGGRRDWIDQQGQTTSGRFVRIHEGRVVIQRGNLIEQIPLSLLAEASRDSALAEHLSQDVMAWGSEESMRGTFVRFENNEVSIRRGSQLVTIPYAELSADNKAFLVLYMSGEERLNELPAEDQTKRISPATLGIDIPTWYSLKNPQRRTWTDARGQQVDATLLGTDGVNVSLRIGSRIQYLPAAEFAPNDRGTIHTLYRQAVDDIRRQEEAARMASLQQEQRRRDLAQQQRQREMEATRRQEEAEMRRLERLAQVDDERDRQSFDRDLANTERRMRELQDEARSQSSTRPTGSFPNTPEYLRSSRHDELPPPDTVRDSLALATGAAKLLVLVLIGAALLHHLRASLGKK